MACGTPVIAPPVGGHMDAVVDGTTGILIPPGRPALLASRIRQLLAHPMLVEAYGVAAADRARSRYSWDRIAGETLAVYDRATAMAACPACAATAKTCRPGDPEPLPGRRVCLPAGFEVPLGAFFGSPCPSCTLVACVWSLRIVRQFASLGQPKLTKDGALGQMITNSSWLRW